jgi:hypothetical protein
MVGEPIDTGRATRLDLAGQKWQRAISILGHVVAAVALCGVPLSGGEYAASKGAELWRSEVPLAPLITTLADFSDARVWWATITGDMSSEIYGDLEFLIRHAKACRNTSISPLTANPRLR